MIEFNKVIIAGRLTRDPDYRATTSGQSVVNFGIACNRRWKDQSGQMQEDASFFGVQAWDKRADFARDYLRKGSGVMIEGRLRQERWTDQNTQQERSKIIIVADRIQFAESRAEAERREAEGGAGEPAGASSASHEDSRDGGHSTADDLPFAPNWI